jgi:hypothetical protein
MRLRSAEHPTVAATTDPAVRPAAIDRTQPGTIAFMITKDGFLHRKGNANAWVNVIGNSPFRNDWTNGGRNWATEGEPSPVMTISICL